MSRQLMDGVWVVICDWTDPETGKSCDLGVDGQPTMFVDPKGNNGGNEHYQCGRHHGIIPQKEKPEFQLPKGHKLNEEIMRPGKAMSGKKIEEELDDDFA